MYIAGFQRNSFVDFPGQIAAVVFTPHCNYDCFYCHNRELLHNPPPDIGEDTVFSFLEKRRSMLDGIVISGGEPTLQKDLKDFIRKLKSFKLLIKLDTNGSNPQVLNNLIEERLLDFVAMDYKAPLDRYEEICGPGSHGQSFLDCLNILKKSNINHELRTTFIPQLSVEEVVSMVKLVAPIDRFVLQTYRPPEHCREQDRFRVNKTPHPPTIFDEAAKLCKPYAEKVLIRR